MNKIENFRKTLTELKSYLATPVITNRDRAGVIQAFEFSFEQSWRAIQKYAADRGSDVGNARKAFAFALANKWIEAADEADWLQMIVDRNQTSHTYQQELAIEILGRIGSRYVGLFEGLLGKLENENQV